MKFLCRNCKAKYQIADDKVAGRTLRMTCQQCGEPIVVRGVTTGRQPTPQHQSRPLAPAALGVTQSALGADFHRQLAAPTREHAAPVHEEWHVAINDVPVGPMRRDEVARKIAMGAIDRESLAWREGMDDWLALKHISELAGLFGQTGPVKSVPPPSAAVVPAPPPPAARAEMAPIGGRQVVALEEYETPEPDISEIAVAAMEPASIAPQPQQRGGLPGSAQLFAFLCGGAFILAAGAWLGVRWLAPAPAPVAPQSAPIAQAPTNPTPQAAPSPEASGSVIQLDEQAIDGTTAANNNPHRSGNATGAAASNGGDKKPKQPQLTDEQKEMLARMGGGLNQGPSNIHAPSDSGHNSAQGAGALTAAQLSNVVNGGRKNLQRCYETALRGSNSTDTVRLDVDIQVSPSGNVTNVKAAGKGLPGMEECITRTVRMWRFPMSGETTQTRFPVVFQPGA
jgi:hypothetical protein